jgi:hypothetical protein
MVFEASGVMKGVTSPRIVLQAYAPPFAHQSRSITMFRYTMASPGFM